MNIETLNIETFKKKIFDFEKGPEWKFEGTRPAIVDFYADWCGPCKMLAPVLEDVSEAYSGKVDIYKVDTEASPELSALFGIRSIPSLLFIPMGSDPAMNAGFISREGFTEAIRDLFGIDGTVG